MRAEHGVYRAIPLYNFVYKLCMGMSRPAEAKPLRADFNRPTLPRTGGRGGASVASLARLVLISSRV
jgi:hypothetical protein